jgi:hypothetical protein
MRLLFVVLVAAIAGLGAAHAQNPPLLIPAPPAPTPPPLFVPPPVPSVVTPIQTPSYGVPPNINTSTPLSSSSRAIYRQPSGASPRDRVAKRKSYKKRRQTAN